MNVQELFVDPNPHHHHLNPVLWDDNSMRPEVRSKLLQIAEHFIDYLNVPNLKLKDITISGSSAGYNYSDYSDIDLHLIVKDVTGKDEELFTAKKNQYNSNYSLSIKDIPVELYVQPAEQPHVSNGIYSVKRNHWINEPKHEEPTVEPKAIKNKARSYSAKINSALRSNDIDQCKQVMDELKRLRKAGLESNGEQSVENLAFKLLRARGQIDKLRKYIDKLTSAKLSLEEQ
jgi:hypothetical protein